MEVLAISDLLALRKSLVRRPGFTERKVFVRCRVASKPFWKDERGEYLQLWRGKCPTEGCCELLDVDAACWKHGKRKVRCSTVAYLRFGIVDTGSLPLEVFAVGDVAERLVGLSEDDLDRVERGDLPETDLVALWEGVRCKGFVGLLRLFRRGSSIDVELEKYREVEPRVTQAAKDAGAGSLGSDPLSVEAKAAEFCEEVREAAYVSYGCSPSRAHALTCPFHPERYAKESGAGRGPTRPMGGVTTRAPFYQMAWRSKADFVGGGLLISTMSCSLTRQLFLMRSHIKTVSFSSRFCFTAF